MQRLTRQRGDPCPGRASTGDDPPGAGAIDRITNQRVPEMREMNSDLVGSTRREAALDEGGMAFERALDTISGERRFSLSGRDDGHLFTIDVAAPDVTGDIAHWRVGDAPDKGGIGPFDSTCGKISRQCIVRDLGLGDDDQAARILVEAMHDTGPPDPSDAGKTGAAMGEQRVDEGSFQVSRGGVDDHSRRLVDHDQVWILKADIESNRLGRRRCILNLRQNYDEFLVASHA